MAGVHITLDSNSKTAMKLTRLNAKKEAEMYARKEGEAHTLTGGFSVAGSPAAGPIEAGSLGFVMHDEKSDGSTTTTADLGMQTIEGLVTKGKRITHTIPAGEMGNDLPIVITTETWVSPDLKVIVMSKSSDPRMGETTYKLTNLSRAEPDPALFQVPADYTVKDQPNGMFVFRDR